MVELVNWWRTGFLTSTRSGELVSSPVASPARYLFFSLCLQLHPKRVGKHVPLGQRDVVLPNLQEPRACQSPHFSTGCVITVKFKVRWIFTGDLWSCVYVIFFQRERDRWLNCSCACSRDHRKNPQTILSCHQLHITSCIIALDYTKKSYHFIWITFVVMHYDLPQDLQFLCALARRIFFKKRK